MKKILTFLAAVLFAALPFAGATDGDARDHRSTRRVVSSHLPSAAGHTVASAKTETREYKLSGFRGLDVSWVYQVVLTQSNKYSVRIEAPENLMDYLDVRVSDNTLKLGLKKNHASRRIEMGGRNVVRAYVSMPSLNELEMSGATKLDASGQFNAHREFKLDLSGASQARGLNIKADEVEIDCSGASHFELSGHFDKLECDMSGAAKGTLTGNVKRVEMDLSGAAKLIQNGSIGSLEMDASGSANYTLTGGLDSFTLEGSGAAKVDTAEAPADRVRVRLSGAANASVDVRKEFSVDLTGAARCRYRAGAKLRITEQSVSRGASLNKL